MPHGPKTQKCKERDFARRAARLQQRNARLQLGLEPRVPLLLQPEMLLPRDLAGWLRSASFGKVDPLCSPREMYRNTAYTYRIAHCFLRVGPWICEFGRLLGRPIWLKIRNLPETNCPRQISIRNQEQSSWKGYISLKLSRAFTTRQASLPPPGSSGEPHTVRGAGRAISEECGSREGDDGDLGPGEVQQEVIRTLDS